MAQEAYNVEVQSLEWIMVMSNLLRRFDTKPSSVSVEIATTGEHATFTFPRTMMPAEAFASAIGAEVAAVVKAPRIVLKPYKAKTLANWQAPTVSYYGQA